MTRTPKPFAKLFDTAFGQLIVTIEYDDERETHGICFRGAAVNGVVPQITPGGWLEAAKADGALASVDQARADEAAEMLHNLAARLTA